jgi:NitT/TauT family transport system substrate-binding protein
MGNTFTLRSIGVIAVAATALFTAGCSSSEAEVGENGLTALTVGTIPTVDSAPLWLAVEQGIFEDHGLDVTVHVAEGGAAVIPAVVSGDDEIGYSNVISSLIAFDSGLPITLIQDCCAAAATPELDTSRVLVLPNGPITDAEGLAGANIAVNSLKNIGEVTIRMALEKRGIDASGITFTQLPYSDMNDALERGDVDAIWQVSPNVVTAVDRGFVPVLSPFVEAEAGGVLGHYLTSEQFAQTNPEIVTAFVDAMAEANEFTEANPDLARATIVKNLQFDEAVVAASNLSAHPSGVTEDEVKVFASKAVEYGIIPEEPDYSVYLWNGGE